MKWLALASAYGAWAGMTAAAGACVLAFAGAGALGCAELREGPGAPLALDGGDGAAPDASEPEEAGGGPTALDMHAIPSPDEIPKVDYRAVYAEARDAVYVVGDETILTWDGATWSRTPVGGVELSGVWASGPLALAVGTFKGTNRGVAMIRSSDGSWVQFASVPHGLRSVFGSGHGPADRVIVVGNDGAMYYGDPDVPMGNGVQIAAPEGTPAAFTESLFFPVLPAVGGNAPDRLLAAGPVGALYAFDGTQWHAYAQHVDYTRTFSAVWGPLGGQWDLIVGANYYGLWKFTGGAKNPATGDLAKLTMLNEERSDDVLRAQQFIYGVWGESTHRFIAVGSTGRVMLFDDGKPNRVLPSPVGARDLRAISATAMDDVWMVGDDGIVLHGAVTF
jgi:hypothetical protein